MQFTIIFSFVRVFLYASPLQLSSLNDGLLIKIYVAQALDMMMFIYLGWESVALNAVLTAELIVKTVMYVNLVKSVAIRERAARYIHWALHAELHVASHSVHDVAIAPE